MIVKSEMRDSEKLVELDKFEQIKGLKRNIVEVQFFLVAFILPDHNQNVAA